MKSQGKLFTPEEVAKAVVDANKQLCDSVEKLCNDIAKAEHKNAALLTAAKLAHGRLVASGGDAVSINALNKAIEGCKV